jgi:hypothetical protein
MTEHISFIPTSIVNVCNIISIKKPNYIELFEKKTKNDKITNIIKDINKNAVINIKELNSFSIIKNIDEIPEDIFNIICDKIIEIIESKNKINFITFRDTLYDILTYNLDIAECLWYIISHFINKIKKKDISDIISKTYLFLKYYNNNYRPIYYNII